MVCTDVCVCVCVCSSLPTSEVVVLFTVSVSERHQLPEQQRVFEDPLNRFDQVRLQGGGVLLGGVLGVKELLKSLVCLCCKKNN